MKEIRRILITGGSGFIGGALVAKLLNNSNHMIFNIDKNSYSSDLKRNINHLNSSTNYFLINVDLKDQEKVIKAIKDSDPDYIFHLAAESHVDRSIESPKLFLESNIIGTYNLLEASKEHWDNLSKHRKEKFRFHHISTDEVFGSLGKKGKFNEDSKYKPNSPYSASKASSDHFVRAWHSTFGLPILITNCSNNFGPFQFPEKLIPLIILKLLNNDSIPIYGDGENIRDWLFVEDHVNALLLVSDKGLPGETYCIGGNNEISNIEIARKIIHLINKYNQNYNFDESKIIFVEDRPGHDKRYSIDSHLIRKRLGWYPQFSFEEALNITIKWYLNNQSWCNYMFEKSNYKDKRIGLI